ncbi:MAG TPA: hypothetical protein VHU84_09830, partial [Lacipirellulaceae bacterium]|nr:hypothetical protein [Lacipirellulaceae bacterium]
MYEFKSTLCKDLLQFHEPYQRTYLCKELGLEGNAQNVASIDDAYAELIQAGYIEKVERHTLMIYSGGIPKPAYRLTD